MNAQTSPSADCTRARLTQRLRAAGLRPTRQRLALAQLIYAGAHRHLSADDLAQEAADAGVGVALGTVYNTLNQLAAAGLLRVVSIGQGRSYFDTNLTPHLHMVDEQSGEIRDLPVESMAGLSLPDLGEEVELVGVDVVLRVRRRASGWGGHGS